MRRSVVVVMLISLGALAPAGAAPACPTTPGVNERCEVWSASYHDADLGTTTGDFPSDVVVAPNGGTVYAALQSRDAQNPFDAGSRWGVVAYDAATGSERWRSHPEGLDHYSVTTSIAVTPNGALVVATGTERESFAAAVSNTVTIAFDSATGQEVWRATWDGSPGTDGAIAIVAGHDVIYVTSYTTPANGDSDYAVLAYDSATGAELWSSKWAGIGTGGQDAPFATGLSPDGSLVYVTGWSAGPGEFNVDYGTIAFHTRGAQAGELAWAARYDGVGVHAPDEVFDLAVGGDGTVYVTGLSDDVPGGPPFEVNYDIATIAYDGRTGEQDWVTRHRWTGNTWNTGTAIAVAGGRVIVTGVTYDKATKDNDVAVVAYDATDGAVAWTAREALAEHQGEYGLDVVAAGNAAYVVGVSGKSVGSIIPSISGTVASSTTFAYNLATGTRTWVSRYNTTGFDNDVGKYVVLSPDGRRLFVLGQLTRNFEPSGNVYDVGLIAYDT